MFLMLDGEEICMLSETFFNPNNAFETTDSPR